ncbi:MAG: BMP family ABC transporter substrate-binding protein, partial [Clostridia bacterium]
DKGEFAGGTIWEADMTTGLIDVAYGDDTMTQQVTPELKAEVEQIKSDIMSGKIVVPSVFE